MKFKVGDYVRIIKPSWASDEFNKAYKNKIVKIIDVDIVSKEEIYLFFIGFDNDRDILTEYEVELYQPVLKRFLMEKKK